MKELLSAIEKTPTIEQEEQQQLKEEIAKLSQQTEKAPLTQENCEVVDALQERMRSRLESSTR